MSDDEALRKKAKIRKDIYDKLVQTVLTRDEVNIVLDLSFHAVDEMFKTLNRVGESAGNPRDTAIVLVTALEIFSYLDLTSLAEGMLKDTGMTWAKLHADATMEQLERVVEHLSPGDFCCVQEQLANDNSWFPQSTADVLMGIDGSLMRPNGKVPLLWQSTLRDETIRIYPDDLVAIIQVDGSYEIGRITNAH